MKKEKSKGEFQHRMFKLLILIIVFVFCGLIAGFVYITVTSSSSPKTLKIEDPDYTTEESIIKSNEKYYKLIRYQDSNIFSLLNNNKSNYHICDINNFYKKHISYHAPCVHTYNATEDKYVLNNNTKTKKNIGVIDYIDKFMKLLSIEYYNKDNNNQTYFKNPRLDNVGRIIVNNAAQKIHIYLSPISQIEYFNSYKVKSYSDIVNFYLKNNIDDKITDRSGKQEQKIIYYEFYLNENDFIYVPSYYFIQIKESVDNLISFEYQDITLFNDLVFKILYNF